MRLMANGSFWLTLLLLVTIIMAKDVYISGLERNFNFKPQHIIQEVGFIAFIFASSLNCTLIRLRLLVRDTELFNLTRQTHSCRLK